MPGLRRIRAARVLFGGFACGMALAVVAEGGAFAAPPCPGAKVKLFVDCSAADPDDDTEAEDGDGTETDPYVRLSDISGRLAPGSSLLFKRGTTCEGTLHLGGAGTAADPVVVGAYGDGTARPVIDAAGGEEPVLLSNAQYTQVSDLELTAPGDDGRPRRGVYVQADDAGAIKGIVLRDLDIHDVGGQPQEATSGGIVAEAGGQDTPTFFDGLTIQGNRIHSVDRQGISLCPPPSCQAAGTLARDPVIRGNLLWNVGGDGISVSAAQRPEIDGNTVQGFGLRSPGNGIAVSGSADSTIADDDVSGGRQSAGYAIGQATDHTDLRGDLSHDNAGGFLLLDGAKDFTVRGNISVNDRAAGFAVGDGPLGDGRIYGNTLYLAYGVPQEIVNAPVPGNVRFQDNIVTRGEGTGRPGAVGWNLDGSGWDLDDNLLHGVPAPTTAADVVWPDPMFAAAGSDDPLGYQLLAGSPALGRGRPLDTLRGFPLSCQQVPAASPNLGAAQAPAAFPPSLAEPFDEDPAGRAPAGWTIIGRPGKATGAAVAPDPEGVASQALALRPTAAAVRDFPATGGDLRADVRIWTQGHSAVRVQLLDGKGKRIADAGFDGSGALTYRDGRAMRTAGFSAPAGAWTRLALILHPGDGSYEVSADGTVLATGKAGAGLPSAIALTAPGPRKGPLVAADDVLVLPSTCCS